MVTQIIKLNKDERNLRVSTFQYRYADYNLRIVSVGYDNQLWNAYHLTTIGFRQVDGGGQLFAVFSGEWVCSSY